MINIYTNFKLYNIEINIFINNFIYIIQKNQKNLSKKPKKLANYILLLLFKKK